MTLKRSLLHRAFERKRDCAGFMTGAIAALCLWIWFVGALANAQIDRGSISGVVTDPTGAGVTGAKVTITNAAMGTQNSTETTGPGNYTIPDLPAGIYSVTAVAPGFSTLVRNGITVSVGETATVDLRLAVGQGAVSITVTADAPLLQTESPQNNVEVSTTDMNELPFNVAGIGSVRDPMSFAALAPGTIVGGWNDIHISGSPGTTYRVFMDGLDDTSAVKGAISDENQPSVESLESQSLMVNNYSAEFGQSAGGIFNYTSKSGTNKLHGTAFNYLENEDLDAGQPFNYTSSADNQKVNPVQRQLDFGGSLGGPVVIPHLYNGHNKTFFFFAYEEYHNEQTLNQGLITVPTTAYRNGDLSSLLLGPILDSNNVPILDCLGRQMINGAVYNPATTRTATCTEVWNEPNLPSFYRNGTQAQYFELYKLTAETVKAVDPQLRVGGPATSNFNLDEAALAAARSQNKSFDPLSIPWKPVWVNEFLSYCATNHLPVDFLSTHPYPQDFAIDEPGTQSSQHLRRSIDSTRDDLRTLREIVDHSPYPKAEIQLTEWNSSPSPTDHAHDSLAAAAFVVKTNLESTGLVDSLSYWTFTDVFEENRRTDEIFHGGFGLINYQEIPKAAFHGYRMMNGLGNRTLAKTEGGIVTSSTETHRIAALVYNYPSEVKISLPVAQTLAEADHIDASGSARELSLHIDHLPPAAAFAVETLDREHGNAILAWEKMGRPDPPTREQTEALRGAAWGTQKEIVHADGNGVLEIKRPVAPWSLVMITQEQ